MKKTISKLVLLCFITLLALSLQSCEYFGPPNLKTYEVKITFCDGRSPVWGTMVYNHKPSNADIKVNGLAVPILYVTSFADGKTEKFMNVCDVEVLLVK